MNFRKWKAHYARLSSILIVFVLLGAMFLVACDSETAAPASLQEIAEQIAGDYGKVESVLENDSDTTVFVFPEDHSSMLNRVEIAIMLNRLYETQGMRHLGLEGWAATDPPMELGWAHESTPYVPGDPFTDREDVLVYMLMDGVLNSMEFIGLVYEDVVVEGIDDAELYAQKIDYSVRFVPLDYLYAIALATMDEADLVSWSDLVDDEELDRAFEFAILSTEYTAETIERYGDLESVAERQALLDEIIDKAEEVGAELRPSEMENMQVLVDFNDIVDARSDVFAESILDIAEENPGAPVAIEIGFLHTERVLELLENAEVSYAAIYPISYSLDSDPSQLSLEAYQRKEAGLSPGEPGSIGRSLTGTMPMCVGPLFTTALEADIRRYTIFIPDLTFDSEHGLEENFWEGFRPDSGAALTAAQEEYLKKATEELHTSISETYSFFGRPFDPTDFQFQFESAGYANAHSYAVFGISHPFAGSPLWLEACLAALDQSYLGIYYSDLFNALADARARLAEKDAEEAAQSSEYESRAYARWERGFHVVGVSNAYRPPPNSSSFRFVPATPDF